MSIYLIFEFIQISFTICLIICEIIEYRERQILVNNLSKTKNPIVRKCMNEGYKKLKNCLWNLKSFYGISSGICFFIFISPLVINDINESNLFYRRFIIISFMIGFYICSLRYVINKLLILWILYFCTWELWDSFFLSLVKS